MMQQPQQAQGMGPGSFQSLLQQPQQAQVAPPAMMAFQSQLQNGPAAQNTYSAVKQMVDQMATQIQTADADEQKHQAWCNSEISKNQAVLDDKSTKLQRLATKIDNEGDGERARPG